MKKIKLLTSAALIIAICSTSTSAFAKGSVLDIDAAINSSLKNSYAIKAQDYAVKESEIGCEQAQKAADKANEMLIMNDRMIALRGKENKTPEEEQMVAHFTPIGQEKAYALKKVKELQPLAAKYKLSVTTNNKEVNENNLRFIMYSQYSNILYTKDLMDTEQKKLDNLLDLYNKTKLQIEIGTMSKAAGKETQAKYLNEKPMIVKQERQMEICQMTINKIMGDALTNRYDSFLKDILIDSPKIKSLDEYLVDASKNRAEIVNAEEYLKLKNKAYDLAAKEYPDESERNNKQAKYDVDEAQNKLDTTKLSIQQEIINSYNDLTKKAKKIEFVKKSFDVSKKSYNESLEKYNLGMISKIDLKDKEIAYKQLEDNLKALQRDLWLSQLKMEYQCGKGTGSAAAAAQ